MKNVLLVFVFIFSALSQNIAQEVSNKNWTLLHERTAD